jgi:hypothetical protein
MCWVVVRGPYRLQHVQRGPAAGQASVITSWVLPERTVDRLRGDRIVLLRQLQLVFQHGAGSITEAVQSGYRQQWKLNHGLCTVRVVLCLPRAELNASSATVV